MANSQERDVIYFSKRAGSQADPYIDITEDLFIQYGKVFLKEIPSEPHRVTVQNNSVSYMTEVYTNDNLHNQTNSFYVDYREGIVYFSNANDGQSKKLTYKGTGIILYPASRIYMSSSEGSGIIKVLQDVANLADNLEPRGLYSSSVSYLKGNIISFSGSSYMAIQDTQGVSPPATSVWQLISQRGEQGVQGSQGAPGTPGSPGEKGEPGSKGDPMYTWVKYANTPTSGMSDNPSGKDYIGLAFNKTTAVKGVNYADYTWSSIRGAQGVPGNQGEKGENGEISNYWRGNYSNTTSYVRGSLVRYEGRVYISTQEVVGINPSNTTVWDLFSDKGADGSGSVDSVNGKSGVITLTAQDVGAISTSERGNVGGIAELNGDGQVVDANGNPVTGAVSSVNNKTGVITLTPADIGSPTTESHNSHTGNGTIHVTSADKTNWNGKETTTGAQAKATQALTNAQAYTTTQINSLLDSVPTALNTLRKISLALGDDANYSTTVTNLMNGKMDKTTRGVAGGVAGLNSEGKVIDAQGNVIDALAIETRTTDPSNPFVGQIWMRTDL